MKNKVNVVIGGLSYTILSEESEEQVIRAAALVDRKLLELNGSQLSSVQRTVLAALNIADEYYKHQDSMSSLRQQIREYSEDASKLQSELTKLQNEQKRGN